MKFTISKKTTPNTCDAKRCLNAPFRALMQLGERQGVKLCEKHWDMLPQEEKVIDITPETETETEEQQIQAYIEPMKQEALTIAEQFTDLTIVNAQEAEQFSGLLQEIHDNAKALEKKRKEATKPLDQAKKTIMSWFRPAQTALEDAKAVLKEKLTDWVAYQEAERAEALESGDAETVLATAEPEVPTSMKRVKIWDFIVENTDLVPRQFFVLDESLIKKAMYAAGPENFSCPGIKVFQKERLDMAGSK